MQVQLQGVVTGTSPDRVGGDLNLDKFWNLCILRLTENGGCNVRTMTHVFCRELIFDRVGALSPPLDPPINPPLKKPPMKNQRVQGAVERFCKRRIPTSNLQRQG